jgi:hypothetical protein
VVQRTKPFFGKKELSEAEQRAKSMDEMFEKAKKDAEDDEPHVSAHRHILLTGHW